MELTQNRVEGFEAFGECADVAVEVVLCLHVCSFDVVMFFLLRFGGSDQPRINSGSIQNTGRLQFVGVFLFNIHSLRSRQCKVNCGAVLRGRCRSQQ